MIDKYLGRRVPLALLWRAQNFYVYRFYDRQGALLYVGMSRDPSNRWRQHLRKSSWAQSAYEVQVDLYESKDAALAAERSAIQAERPIHNIACATGGQ